MIFSDKMVFQREKPIPVWGEAEPGASVHITFDGQRVSVSADEAGTWKAMLPAHEAGSGYELTVASGTESLCFTDVCVGEVWLAGGQSNMEYHLGFEANLEQVLACPPNPSIRFFDYPEVAYEGQLNDYQYQNEGFWRGCTAEDLPYYSAVAYYFAVQIQSTLDVPVGIIGCNWGGTPACAWMDPERLRGTDGEVWVTEYEKAIQDLDFESYRSDFLKNPMNDRTNQLGDPFGIKAMKIGLTREEQEQIMKMNENADMAPAMGPYYERRPGGLYETMLKKVVPYAIRGVIWYQGETDGDNHPEAYTTVFSRMIENWRSLWEEEIPFLFVQLAPFRRWLACVGEPYAIVRRCQEQVSKTVPNTWMASSGDAGMEWDIHPKNKKPIGERLALLARGHVYGEDILCDAPEAVKAEQINDTIRISFAHGKGLHLEGEKIHALRCIFDDGNEADVTDAVIQDEQLILQGCDGAKEIRFAIGDYYEVNLYNEARIPVKPFVLAVQ